MAVIRSRTVSRSGLAALALALGTLAAGGCGAQPASGAGAAAPSAALGAAADFAPNATLVRDVAYGPDPRHRLDVAVPGPPAADGLRPVVLFAHGGGYGGGSKDRYDNIMRWAVGAGMVGVNMNYRLHPAVGFPAQEEDVAAAVRWIRANVARHGGDPDRVFLFGHSSGGAMVANYAAMPRFERDPGIIGLILLSPVVDINAYERPWPYYGTTDSAQLAELSPITHLVKTDLPILLGVGDRDSVTASASVPAAHRALCAARACRELVVTGGDHQGVARAVGGDGDPAFAEAAAAFVRSVR